MQVQLFIPCFIDQLFPRTALSTVKVLRKAGCEVLYNTNQTCCGQTAANAGFFNEAEPVCQKFLKDFSAEQPIVAPSGSCVGFVRSVMGDLTQQSTEWQGVAQKVVELSDFLVNKLDVTALDATLEGRATYHDACAALRECGIKSAPRKLLEQVEGLELVENEEAETCCGFGGTFATKFEPISVAMAQRKVDAALATKSQYIISTDSSCLMHLKGYIEKFNLPIKAIHIADVLANAVA